MLGSVFFASPPAMAVDNSKEPPYENISAQLLPGEIHGETIIGQTFRYLAGAPLIKAYSIEIPVGKSTDLHRHAVPLFAFVVSGVLETDYGSKGRRTISPGSVFVEAIDWCHVGKAVGTEPVKVIGVYLGQEKPDQSAPEQCAKPD